MDQDTPTLFNAIAHRYERWSRILSANGIVRWRRSAIAAMLLATGDTVLDIGCGTGEATRILAQRVGPTGEVLGLDPSPAMLSEARRTAARYGGPPIQWIQGVAESLPLGDDRVDGITIFFALRNMDDWRRGLLEARRVLRSGGRIAILEMLQPSTTRAALSVRGLELVTARFKSQRMEPFRWLPRSLLHAPTEPELLDHLVALGFRLDPPRSWLGGLVTVLSATLTKRSETIGVRAPKPTVVVWASDGSDSSLQAGLWIRDHLRPGTKVHLITVQPPPPRLGPYTTDEAVVRIDEFAWQRDLAASKAILNDNGFLLETHLILGHSRPGLEILRMLETIGPDLVVLGKKSRDLGARFVWGDVSREILQGTDVPVLLVQNQTPSPNRGSSGVS